MYIHKIDASTCNNKQVSFYSDTIPYGNIKRNLYMNYKLTLEIIRTAPVNKFTLNNLQEFGIVINPIQYNSITSCKLNDVTVIRDSEYILPYILMNNNKKDMNNFFGMNMPNINTNFIHRTNIQLYEQSDSINDNRNYLNYLEKIEIYGGNNVTTIYHEPDMSTIDDVADDTDDKLIYYFNVYEIINIPPFRENLNDYIYNIRKLNLNFNITGSKFFDGLLYQVTDNHTNRIDKLNVGITNAKLYLNINKTQPLKLVSNNIKIIDIKKFTKRITLKTINISYDDFNIDEKNNIVTFETDRYKNIGKVNQLLIFVEPIEKINNNSKSEYYEIPHNYISIHKLEVDANATGYKLGEYDNHQLYQLSYNNGVNMSFLQWQSKIGSIIMLNSDDITVDNIDTIRLKISVMRQRTVQPSVVNLDCNITILLINEISVSI